MAADIVQYLKGSPGERKLLKAEQNKMVADLTAVLTGNILLSAPGIRIGTGSAAEVKFDAIIYQIAGMRYTLAAGESPFTATTHDVADPDAAGREATYTLSVAAGATELTFTKSADAALGASVVPATPASQVRVGQVKVAHDGSAIFDATTTLLSAAHITDTYASETPYAITAARVNP